MPKIGTRMSLDRIRPGTLETFIKISDVAGADFESVEEILEGNALEADAGEGVENPEDPDFNRVNNLA